MTNATPIAFLVDSNGVPLRQGVVVDAATGAPTIVTINPATGLPVLTVVGSGGGGSGNVSNVGTFASAAALQTAFPAASNLGAFGNVGASAPYAVYQSNGSAWAPVGSGSLANVGTYASTGALQTAFPAASNKGSFAYVGSSSPYTLYTSDGTTWIASSGSGGTPSTTTPNALASTPVIGTSTAFMRADAVLPLPSINAVGGLPQSSGNYNASTNTILTGAYAGQNLVSGTLPTGTSTAPTGFKVTVAGTPGVDSLGALSVGDVVFYSSALVWDVMGGAAQTTLLYKGDGTTSGRLVAAVPGLDYNPGPLFQTGVPIGVMPNCTVAAAGVITYGSTAPTAYPNGVWMWWSAAALYAGSLAGWYWTVLTGTAGAGAGGTVYNSYLPATGTASQLAGTTSGATVVGAYPIPSSPSTSGITGGTHTLTTGSVIWAPGPTMPAGYLGNNGSGEAKYLLRCNSSTTNKAFSAGGGFWQPSNPTTVTNVVNTATFMNAGVQTRQIGAYSDIGSPLDYTTAVDTTIAQVLNPKFNINATNSGNDFLVCEFLRIMLVPRA